MKTALLLLAACGDSHATPDAEACAGATCAATCCTPAADCVAEACACPANFIPPTPTFVTGVVVKDLPQIPGLVAAIGQFDQPTQRDALLVAYDPATAQTGIDIDLATATDVKVGFGYQIDANQNIRSSYRVMTGTVRFTAVCAAGVAGTVSNAALVEIDIFSSLDPIADGCTMPLPSVTFAIAGDCTMPSSAR